VWCPLACCGAPRPPPGLGGAARAAADGPGSLERKFKDWLQHCHATLDKRIRFSGMADDGVQARARRARPPAPHLRSGAWVAGACRTPLNTQCAGPAAAAGLAAPWAPSRVSCDPRAQASVRARFGASITAFDRITDGARTVAIGDAVRLASRPPLVGEALHFIVHQARPRPT